MRAKVGQFFRDRYPSGRLFVETQARTDFNAARDYAISLIEIHDARTGGKAGRPPVQLEALKRSSLILAVTAWESFVEDTVQQQLEKRLNAATTPSQVQSIFQAVAQEWLEGARRYAPDLIKWTGDSWKQIIRESLKAKLERFHTPNTENVDSLFQRYLQCRDLSKNWSWQSVTHQDAAKKLDALIKVRGRAVHRGMRLHPMSRPESPMGRTTVIKALNLIYNLVDATERALQISPTMVPPQPPVTQP
jgi:hypothetical protein